VRPIDADALKRIAFLCENADIRFSKQFMAVAVSDIDSAPTLSPDEVRGVGERIPITTDFEHQCSKCGKKLDDYVVASEWAGLAEVPNYCPNCGAKMEVSDDA
jgi:hypothetical protein